MQDKTCVYVLLIFIVDVTREWLEVPQYSKTGRTSYELKTGSVSYDSHTEWPALNSLSMKKIFKASFGLKNIYSVSFWILGIFKSFPGSDKGFFFCFCLWKFFITHNFLQCLLIHHIAFVRINHYCCSTEKKIHTVVKMIVRISKKEIQDWMNSEKRKWMRGKQSEHERKREKKWKRIKKLRFQLKSKAFMQW